MGSKKTRPSRSIHTQATCWPGMEYLSGIAPPAIITVTVMIPIIVAIAAIVSVAVTVPIVAPLVPGMSIVPIAVAVTEGDVSEVEGYSATLAVAAAVPPVPVRHTG